MRDSDFTKLLKNAAKASQEHQAWAQRITEAFEERYGVTHSDVDADQLIDVLDYGGLARGLNAALADEIMAEHGHPKKP